MAAVSLEDAVHQRLGMGEQCYLKPEQDASCRLFGCDAAYQQIMTTTLPEAPRIGLCKKHARMRVKNEIHIAGIAGKPVTR